MLFPCPASARIFSSMLKLKVYLRGSAEVPDRVLGFTPSRKGHPVVLPKHGIWYVRPMEKLDDNHFKQLVRLTTTQKIPGLDLSDHWELNNESLAPLHLATSLVLLDLSRTPLSDKSLIYLKGCHRLAILLLPQAVTNEGLANLKVLRALRELSLDQTHITDEGMDHLAPLARLENLDLSSTHVTDKGLAVLNRLPHLKRLVLGAMITDVSAQHLEALMSLEEVDISQTQIGEEGISALGTLPALRTVYLPRQVTDRDLKGLSKSPSLRALDLTRTGVTDKGVQSISKIKTLEEVALSQTRVGNTCLSYLADLPELRMLEISDTLVTSAGLAPLARLKKLEMLSLSWKTLNHEDLQGMAQLRQLKTIVLNGVSLPEETMAQLRRINAPSPWDTAVGAERGYPRETRKPDQAALAAPVVSPGTAGSMVTKPRVPHPTPASVALPDAVVSAPSHPEPIATRPAAASSNLSPLPSKTSMISAAPLREYRAPKDRAPMEANPEIAAPPIRVKMSGESEENLLKAIALQSNPAHAGTFSGLSGMRQLRQTESLVTLNTIATEDKSNIASEQDKPENFIGEISVGSGRSH